MMTRLSKKIKRKRKNKINLKNKSSKMMAKVTKINNKTANSLVLNSKDNNKLKRKREN